MCASTYHHKTRHVLLYEPPHLEEGQQRRAHQSLSNTGYKDVVITKIAVIPARRIQFFNCSGNTRPTTPRTPPQHRHLTGWTKDPLRPTALIPTPSDGRYDVQRDTHLNQQPIYIVLIHDRSDKPPLTTTLKHHLTEVLTRISCPSPRRWRHQNTHQPDAPTTRRFHGASYRLPMNPSPINRLPRGSTLPSTPPFRTLHGPQNSFVPSATFT